ncbi:MAG: bifunctional 4-hydroxy-2-oxoglutarate aldolase/2-dehydro-3-deoxy-phosphogluconate aldolase [Acidimicrobiia bacterium]|nr:bifunctional 4-hydroxy-2-oxoglutarate aldolase/2-dehydro-3-deoxy-phosphogluconate aldolase [Acidimicrobiia bacterium]
MNSVGPLSAVEESGILPVAVVEEVDAACRLAEAVSAEGLACMEVTLRTASAATVIRRLAREFPDMTVGAGTVLSVGHAQAAALAGARFVVSPGFDPEVVEWCHEHNLPVIPGAVTPTEIGAVLRAGVSVVKFFPAEAMGGAPTLQSLAGPFPEVRFLPTGGLDESNLDSYLRVQSVLACGSSWVVDRRLIEAGDFSRIRERCRLARQIVDRARSSR